MMEYNEEKLDELILALPGALEFENGRAWKRLDFAAMDRLHAKGMISNPVGRQESVYLTEEGLKMTKALAAKHLSP